MAYDGFIQIEGIPGECTDAKHKDWIEIDSYSHGVSQQSSGSVSSGGSRSASRCDHAPFSISKTFDKASVKLAVACCKGTHIPLVTLELCRAGDDKQKYMEYKLKDVMIGDVSVSHGGGGLPMENVTMYYGEIEWTYIETDHKTGRTGGKVAGKWNLHDNSGG